MGDLESPIQDELPGPVPSSREKGMENLLPALEVKEGEVDALQDEGVPLMSLLVDPEEIGSFSIPPGDMWSNAQDSCESMEDHIRRALTSWHEICKYSQAGGSIYSILMTASSAAIEEAREDAMRCGEELCKEQLLKEIDRVRAEKSSLQEELSYIYCQLDAIQKSSLQKWISQRSQEVERGNGAVRMDAIKDCSTGQNQEDPNPLVLQAGRPVRAVQQDTHLCQERKETSGSGCLMVSDYCEPSILKCMETSHPEHQTSTQGLTSVIVALRQILRQFEEVESSKLLRVAAQKREFHDLSLGLMSIASNIQQFRELHSLALNQVPGQSTLSPHTENAEEINANRVGGGARMARRIEDTGVDFARLQDTVHSLPVDCDDLLTSSGYAHQKANITEIGGEAQKIEVEGQEWMEVDKGGMQVKIGNAAGVLDVTEDVDAGEPQDASTSPNALNTVEDTGADLQHAPPSLNLKNLSIAVKDAGTDQPQFTPPSLHLENALGANDDAEICEPQLAQDSPHFENTLDVAEGTGSGQPQHSLACLDFEKALDFAETSDVDQPRHATHTIGYENDVDATETGAACRLHSASPSVHLENVNEERTPVISETLLWEQDFPLVHGLIATLQNALENNKQVERAEGADALDLPEGADAGQAEHGPVSAELQIFEEMMGMEGKENASSADDSPEYTIFMLLQNVREVTSSLGAICFMYSSEGGAAQEFLASVVEFLGFLEQRLLHIQALLSPMQASMASIS